jgi:hypothetical protein
MSGDGGTVMTSCAAGQPSEVEPNQTAETASKVPFATFCGALSDGNDVDFLEATLPDDAMGFELQRSFTNPVEVFLTVGTQPRIQLQQGVMLPFEAGAKYLFEVRGVGGKASKYRFDLTFTK